MSQVEQLPSLLEASRSGQVVRGWDVATLERALHWGRFYHQLHDHLNTRPGLRATLERHLGQQVLGRMRRCPELLGLSLLENRALPATALQHLLHSLLLTPCEEAGEAFTQLLARRKAASLLLLPSASPTEAAPDKAQAQLLLRWLREGGKAQSPALLDQLPTGPALYKAVAAALLEPGAEEEAQAMLLPWLLQGGDSNPLAALCRLLSASCAASLCGHHLELCGPYLNLLASWGSCLAYDPLLGNWKASASSLDNGVDVMSWQELRDRVFCLYLEPEPLPSTVQTHLIHLKSRDGNFEARGLSIWTDILLDLEASALQREPR